MYNLFICLSALYRLAGSSEYAHILNRDHEQFYASDINKAPLAIKMNKFLTLLHLDNINVLPYYHPFKPTWQLPDNTMCNELTVYNKKDFNLDYVKLLHEEHFQFYHSDSINI